MRLTCILLAFFWVTISYSQEYLKGKLLNGTQQLTIQYDRTQFAISSGVYQAVYKVFGADKRMLYSITATHDRQKQYFFIAAKPVGQSPISYALKYEREKSALVFCDVNNLDTVFSSSGYKYLFSFTDTLYDFPVLHQLNVGGNTLLLLDPLTKLRLKKHSDIVKQLWKKYPYLTRQKIRAIPILAADDDDYSMRAFLTRQRNAMYKTHVAYADSIKQLRASLEQKALTVFKKQRLDDIGTNKYSGEKKGGKADGKGVLVDDKGIYAGTFTKGDFSCGSVIENTDSGAYCGSMCNRHYEGAGMASLSGGRYRLGRFIGGILVNGVALLKDSETETYFGVIINDKRSGYGELQQKNGSLYCGIFNDGILQKGYAKEVDPFGNALYFIFEDGEKVQVDESEVERFFSFYVAGKK